MEACHQALTLDETNGRALELEKSIRGELAISRANAIVVDARVELDRGALTAADGLLQQARALVADSPDVRALERDLRMARVELEQMRQRAQILRQTLDAAEQALAKSQLESALAFARGAAAGPP